MKAYLPSLESFLAGIACILIGFAYGTVYLYGTIAQLEQGELGIEEPRQQDLRDNPGQAAFIARHYAP